MMMKALLAWAGLRAAPSLHNDEVHETLNRSMAAVSGFRVVASQSRRVSETMTSDPSDTHKINESLERMRVLMAEVARRAER